MRKAFLIGAVLALAACGNNDDASRTAGGITLDEARALDEAAEIIEERRLPSEALRPQVPASPAPSSPAKPAPTGDSRP